MPINKVYRWAILIISSAALFILGCEKNLPNEAESQGPDEMYMSSLHKQGSDHIIPIALARADNPRDFVPDMLDEIVTVKGVITSPDFITSPIFDVTNALHFIQDNSAGMRLFAHYLISPPVLEMGDQVVVTGVINQYDGSTQIELQSASDLQIIGKRKLPTPKKIHARHLADQVGERIEGKLVRLENVKLVDGYQFPPDGQWGLVRVVDSKGDTADVFIDNDTDIDGIESPNGKFNITGLVNQYTTPASLDSGYQLVPRGLFDIE